MDTPLLERAPAPSEDAPGLLMVAYYYPPQNASGAQRPFRFAKYLRRLGYRPQVISRDLTEVGQSSSEVHRTCPAGEGAGLTEAAAICIRLAERTILPYSDQLPWAPYAVATARLVAKENPPSVVFSTSPPVGAHMAAAMIKREFDIPWIADFRDPLLGNPFRTRRWANSYDAFLERVIVRHADLIVTNTDRSTEMIRSRYPRLAHKVHLIWNGFDPEEDIGPLPIPSRTHRLLLHAGTLYGGRHPGMLLESLKRMISSGSFDPRSLRVRLIGDSGGGDAWRERSDLASLVSAGWVEYVNRAVPLQEARREMSEADYLLLLDLNELGTGSQVPGKLFEYIRIGRPILAFTVQDSSTSRLLAEAGIPYQCIYQSDAPGEVDRKVAAFLSLPTRPVAASEWFQTSFNAVAQTQTLANLAGSLVRAKDRAGIERRT
ncbi:MAG TPA: glycosyltransferase [Bryobacteraceae bacterium]